VDKKNNIWKYYVNKGNIYNYMCSDLTDYCKDLYWNECHIYGNIKWEQFFVQRAVPVCVPAFIVRYNQFCIHVLWALQSFILNNSGMCRLYRVVSVSSRAFFQKCLNVSRGMPRPIYEYISYIYTYSSWCFYLGVNFLTEVLSIYEANYPETLCRSLVINGEVPDKMYINLWIFCYIVWFVLPE